MQELDLLNDKLELLLKKYTALQAENKKLQQTIVHQRQSIEELNGKIGNLEEELLTSKTSSAIHDDKDKKVVKKQIDTLIGDIDRILATLHD